jgi:hypothetical protein
MAVPDVHPSRGTAGTAPGASAVRSNEGLGHILYFPSRGFRISSSGVGSRRTDLI